jgi:hypothetical protein
MCAYALYISSPDPARREEFFFCPNFTFAPSSPRHYFFTAMSFFFTPLRQTNERTSERTVTLSFSRHVHLLLTITNFSPFASLLFLLTLGRLQR